MAETRRQCCRSGPTAPSRDAWRTIRYIAGLQSVDIIANQNANSEWHFFMDRGNIPVVRFPELASCMMSDPELHAPEPNGPSAHSKRRGDVLLKNAVGF